MSIQNKTIFITGGAGFIGSTLASLLCTDNNVVIFDNLSRNTMKHGGLGSQPRVRFVEGDILDYPAIAEAMRGADLVVHAAVA